MKIVLYRISQYRHDIVLEHDQFNVSYVGVRGVNWFIHTFKDSEWIDLAWFNCVLFNFGDET